MIHYIDLSSSTIRRHGGFEFLAAITIEFASTDDRLTTYQTVHECSKQRRRHLATSFENDRMNYSRSSIDIGSGRCVGDVECCMRGLYTLMQQSGSVTAEERHSGDTFEMDRMVRLRADL